MFAYDTMGVRLHKLAPCTPESCLSCYNLLTATRLTIAFLEDPAIYVPMALNLQLPSWTY